MRVQKFPAWEVETNFKTSWENGLQECSSIIMNMLIEHDRSLLIQVKTQIKDLEIKLKNTESESRLNNLQSKIKKNLDVSKGGDVKK